MPRRGGEQEIQGAVAPDDDQDAVAASGTTKNPRNEVCVTLGHRIGTEQAPNARHVGLIAVIAAWAARAGAGVQQARGGKL